MVQLAQKQAKGKSLDHRCSIQGTKIQTINNNEENSTDTPNQNEMRVS